MSARRITLDRAPITPLTRPCEYCGGAGACEGGDLLLPQGDVYRATEEDRDRAGLPPWA